jgi:hypothetical protein
MEATAGHVKRPKEAEWMTLRAWADTLGVKK